MARKKNLFRIRVLRFDVRILGGLKCFGGYFLPLSPSFRDSEVQSKKKTPRTL